MNRNITMQTTLCFTPITLAVAIVVSACTVDSRVGALPDATTSDAGGADGDAAGIDAGAGDDAGLPSGDGGPVADAGTPSDAGAACATLCGPASCGTRTCGRSDCGYPCGECFHDEHCFAGGTCMPGTGPGEPCLDAFGGRVWEGDEGFRVCPTDPALLQPATCSGAGADAWFSGEPCVERCIEALPGARCIDSRDCGGGTCDEYFGRCAEHCEAPDPTCAAGTACYVPGDIAGMCLTECAVCDGAGCPEGQVCRLAFVDAFVCVPKEHALFACL
jgi:hypothetical protein